MTKTIESYYASEYKESYLLIGISTLSFILGILAIAKWGNVGAGILLIFGGFAIYQIIRGFWVLFVEQNTKKKKLATFEKNSAAFVEKEKNFLEKETKSTGKNKTYQMVGFLIGLLCLAMGAFGGWNETTFGIGIGLSIQCATMLILGLLANYRASYYFEKLKKFTP